MNDWMDPSLVFVTFILLKWGLFLYLYIYYLLALDYDLSPVIDQARVRGALKYQLLEALELGVSGVSGQAQNEALAGREVSAHVPQTLERKHAVRHRPR